MEIENVNKYINQLKWSITGTIIINLLLIFILLFLIFSGYVIYNNMIILPSKSNLTNYNRIHDLLLKSRYIIYILFLIFVILMLTLLIRIINNPNVKKDIQLLNDGKYVLVECTAIEFDKGGKNTDRVFKVKNDHTGEIFKLSYTGGPIYSGDKFIVIIAPNTNKKCIVMINGVNI